MSSMSVFKWSFGVCFLNIFDSVTRIQFEVINVLNDREFVTNESSCN